MVIETNFRIIIFFNNFIGQIYQKKKKNTFLNSSDEKGELSQTAAFFNL